MKDTRMKIVSLVVCFVILMFSIAIIPSTGAQSAYKMINNPYNIDRCRIDWPYVAYQDDRNVATGVDIFCRNMSTGDEWTVSSQLNNEFLTYIGDGYIIYDVYNGVDTDVWGHNIATRTSFPIFTGAGNQNYGYIFKGRYVIPYGGNQTAAGDNDVVAYDLNTGTYINIATTGNDEMFYDLYGNWVVYQYDTFPSTNADIHAYNLLTTATVAIANGPNYEYVQGAMPTSNYVVYEDASNDDLYLYKFSDVSTKLISNTAVNPTVWGMSDTYVVWEDYRNGATAPDIYGYSIATGTEFPICTAVKDQKFPWVTDNLVFWDDNRADPDGTPNNWGAGGTDAWDVYGKYLPNGTEFKVTGASDPYSQRLPIVYFEDYLIYYFGDHRNAFLYGYTPPTTPPEDVYFYNIKEGKEYAVRQVDTPKSNIRMTTMSPDKLIYWIEEETPGDSDIWGYQIPEVQQFANIVAAFMPVANYHLQQVNKLLECITESLPDDIPDDVQELLDGIQEHIDNANTTGNSIYANNELLKAIDLCEEVQELLGITCS